MGYNMSQPTFGLQTLAKNINCCTMFGWLLINFQDQSFRTIKKTIYVNKLLKHYQNSRWQAGEPDNGVIKYCFTMTSRVNESDPPSEVSMVPCAFMARYFCVQNVPGMALWITPPLFFNLYLNRGTSVT